MGCADVRLLKTIGSVEFTGQERAALNKLTMPAQRLPLAVVCPRRHDTNILLTI